jgi:outer membrane protein insertion porin family
VVIVRAVFFPAFICMAFLITGNAVQLPHNLEECLPIPTLAQEIQQRNADAPPEKHIKLETLTFEGNTGLAPDELDKIVNSLTSRTYDNSPAWVQEVRERILDEWQHRGFFRAQIENLRAVARAETDSERPFTIAVAIHSGQRYGLKAIPYQNNTQFSQAELRAMFPVIDGETFDTHQLRLGLENIRKAYGTKGFINFTDVPSFDIDEEHGLIAVDLEIYEGKRYTFGQVRVLGLEPSLAQRLLHESGIETGKIFDTSLLNRFVEENRTSLPNDAGPESDVLRRLDDQLGTVDITMDFRRCPNIAQH